MSHSIDFKSFVIGGLVVLVVVCSIGAVVDMSPEYNGRFKIETTEGNAYVLDSATGQVWSLSVLYGQAKDSFLAPKLP